MARARPQAGERLWRRRRTRTGTDEHGLRRGAAVSPYRSATVRARPWPSRLFRLVDDAQIRLRRLPTLRVLLFGFLVGDRAGDDHLLARLPVHRRGDAVLGRELERVDDAQHLVEIATGRHRVDEDGLDLLVGTDDE